MQIRLPWVLAVATFFQVTCIGSARAGTDDGALSNFEKWLAPRLVHAAAPNGPAVKGAQPETGAGLVAGSGVSETVSEGNPVTMADGPVASYQGVHMAVAVLAADGEHLDLRPLNRGFRTKERFKLQVIATFAGAVTVENINPKWERKLIYPGKAGGTTLVPGKEMLIPAGKDEYFEFAGTQGEEQLVVTVRDPQATEQSRSRGRIHRKDEETGSNFVQEVFSGSYPDISGVLKVRHY